MLEIKLTSKLILLIIRHIESHNSTDGPLFLAVGLHKPHIPHKFPEEFLKHHPYQVRGMINDS